MPGQAGDAGGGRDEAVPVGAEAVGQGEGFDVAMFLAAVALAVDGLMTLGRGLLGCQAAQGVKQARLVALDLGQERIAALLCRLEGFFGNAAHRR